MRTCFTNAVANCFVIVSSCNFLRCSHEDTPCRQGGALTLPPCRGHPEAARQAGHASGLHVVAAPIVLTKGWRRRHLHFSAPSGSRNTARVPGVAWPPGRLARLQGPVALKSTLSGSYFGDEFTKLN
ncbi:hypothetical protein E2C01_101712 [Portunus trituberculatus]|uniref:Uncharacterized protein n=1 Tax=Portunus trituberculatus TaxID=210409 RepID=A0A5B7KFK7_PORTR|nr:hypothetical protein [Portunus trituberculatus]